ncbi:MAG: nucleotide pyrophosphohydrolase [Lachnospiraceae bacterium]|nr:nucleotide pyrophosphohydrolase [Lachnospiraceae bacterium]
MDFSLNEMQEMQKKLEERYKERWEPLVPESSRNKLLWMVGEIGEVIDIVKKNGPERTAKDEKTREHLLEEMSDILMYYNEVMMCFNISPEELKQAYTQKIDKNMNRWK